MTGGARTERDILADVKKLAVEYYDLTGKPLGVSGEIAEFEGAEKLGLELTEVRTPGYDATRRRGRRTEKIQIKGRRQTGPPLHKGTVSKIDLDKPFDTVMLVLMDARYNAVEIWEATRDAVCKRLRAPGSRARNERGQLAISQFRSIAVRVWPRVGE